MTETNDALTAKEAKKLLRQQQKEAAQKQWEETRPFRTNDLIARMWTPAIIKKVLGEPDFVGDCTNWNMGRSYRYVAHSWKRDRVIAAELTPEFAKLSQVAQSRNAKRMARLNRTPEQIAADDQLKQDKVSRRLKKKYYNWRFALQTGCEYMFALNRLAKDYDNPDCTLRLRDNIYNARNGLIEMLYGRGYCTECIIHKSELPEKTCFGCDGSGIRDSGDDCYRCDGTGIYLPAKQIRFVAFRFEVGGKRYAWHQPQEYVTFSFKATDAPKDYVLPTDPKDVPTIPVSYRDAIELITWIVASAKAEQLAKAAA